MAPGAISNFTILKVDQVRHSLPLLLLPPLKVTPAAFHSVHPIRGVGGGGGGESYSPLLPLICLAKKFSFAEIVLRAIRVRRRMIPVTFAQLLCLNESARIPSLTFSGNPFRWGMPRKEPVKCPLGKCSQVRLFLHPRFSRIVERYFTSSFKTSILLIINIIIN